MKERAEREEKKELDLTEEIRKRGFDMPISVDMDTEGNAIQDIAQHAAGIGGKLTMEIHAVVSGKLPDGTDYRGAATVYDWQDGGDAARQAFLHFYDAVKGPPES